MADATISIRQASVADLPALCAVIHAAYAEYRGCLDPPSGAHDETPASLRRKLTGGWAALASDGGAVVGCVFYAAEPETVYLGRLAVLPSHRRWGVGRRLVAFVEAEALALARRQVQLGVRLQLPDNQRFYAKLGYRIAAYGCHPGYSRPTYVTMVKDLAPQPECRKEVP